MHTHRPASLEGPVTATRDWWPRPVSEPNKPVSPRRCRQRTRTMNQQPGKPSADPNFRADLVERIRREIAEGTYETPEKWEIALDRLLKRLEEEQ